MKSNAKELFKVLIRPLTLEDAATSYHWRNDESLWKYTVNKPKEMATPETEKQWLELRMKDPTERRFAIMADDTYIGNVHFTNLTEESFAIQIFIGNKQYHKKGISPLAIYQLCYYGAHILMRKVGIFRIHPDNETVLSIVRGFGLKEFSEQDGWISVQFPVNLFPNPACTVAVLLSLEDDLEKILNDILSQKTTVTFDILVGGNLSATSLTILQLYSERFPGKFAPALKNGTVFNLASAPEITWAALGDQVIWYEEMLFRENTHALNDIMVRIPQSV